MVSRRIHSADKPQITASAQDEVVQLPAGLPTTADSPEEPEPTLLILPPSATKQTRQSVGAFEAPLLPHLPPIIRSKIEPPPLRSTTLTRHRLLDRLPIRDPKRVTVIVADPGFGKTTLLADFSSRYQGRCLWYRLDDTDRDWVTLVNYVIAAARESVPDFGKSTTTLLTPITGASPQKEAVVGTLMHELQALGDQPTTLVFDDLQTVDDSPAVDEFVSRLFRDAPASFSFVLSSRRRPTIHLARWSGMGDLSELTTDDLRFSAAETERLFSEAYGQPLEAEVLHELDSRTQGWAASLQLFHSLVQGRSASGVRSAVRLLSGANSPVYEFLAEEVLDQMPSRLSDFVLRAAILESIVAEYVVAVMGAETTLADADTLMADAEKAGVLTPITHGSRARHFHPLLREFLLRKLSEDIPAEEFGRLQGQVARAAEGVDLLAACYHYIEAGQPNDAMRCLGSSAIQTLGSGRTGDAARLIDRLENVPPTAAVVAIQARRAVEDGDLVRASEMLRRLDVGGEPPTVRAVVRHTRLTLGWSLADNELMFSTLRQITEDHETPAILRDIAQIFVDASPMAKSPVPFPSIARRLQSMALTQAAQGQFYYSGISYHNAAMGELASGRFAKAIQCAQEALEKFEGLSPIPAEWFSTHSVLALCALEQGRIDDAEDEIKAALASGTETGDVDAECAYALATIGEHQRAARLLVAADSLARQGRSDLPATLMAAFTRALLSFPTRPELALASLEQLPSQLPLDFGDTLDRRTLISIARLLSGDYEGAEVVAESARVDAQSRLAQRAETRLNIVLAIARADHLAFAASIATAASVGHMALLQVADLVGRNLHMLKEIPDELTGSIARWRTRWLPVLRRQLESGNTPNAAAAATLLDEYGTADDVGRLRAFDRTYRKRGRGTGLGLRLARRTSPTLLIDDLGRVNMRVGDRDVAITDVRRKPASLLMFLATRPNFTATREQALDALWPDVEPESGANSLNQSLYFLRREIDPWYEDGISVDYIVFESELVWLDSTLVRVSSAEFIADARELLLRDYTTTHALSVLSKYSGPFCPEFEYEQWAIAWRSRVHAAFLDFAHAAVQRSIARHDLSGARDIASVTLSIDPDAEEVERELVRLYWQLGARSAAEAQYEHLAARDRADGIDPVPLAELVGTD